MLSVFIEKFGYQWKEKFELLFDNFSLHVEHGKCLAVMGPSGVGKSSLLKILLGILGIEKAPLGFVEYLGNKIMLSETDKLSQIFSMVPQTPMLLPWKTVEENLKIVLPQSSKNGKAQREKSVYEMLQVVGLENCLKKYPWQLSQGMAARVNFARTLLLDTPIVLLDEPFAALDANRKEELGQWLIDLRRSTKKTMILVTHDRHEASAVSDSVLHLNKPHQT
jgi:ABC-type nitrate/sulfonate/bicarbonate transport system ATPase subunit